jgi:hypothetical protein
MIRFKIVNGDDILLTGWQDEPVRHGAGPQTAVIAMTELRQQYPDAAISIERTTVIPKSDDGKVRFKIQAGQAVMYSKIVSDGEADALEAELRTSRHVQKFGEIYGKVVITRG